MRLDNVRLLCATFDDTFRFYRDFMEFAVTWGEPGVAYASFDTGTGGGSLALFKRELMGSVLPAQDDEHISLRVALVFEASDVDAVHVRAQQAGVPILSAPADRPDWGIRTLHLQDPESNLIEVFSSLPREQWSKDLQAEAAEQNH